MKIIHVVIFSMLSTIYMTSSAAGDSQMATLVQGNNQYALDLYHEIRQEEGNHFISPYSLSSAFAMAYSGARENTAKEIADVLYFSQGQEHLPSAFKKLNQQLLDTIQEGGNQFRLANGLFQPSNKVQLINPEYKVLLRDYYDAEIFSGDAKVVNNWVANKTENKIDKIIDGIDPELVAIILNAIYFKGDWAFQFNEEHTEELPFFTDSTNKINVPFMYQHQSYQALTNEDFKMISIPYEGDKVSMVIFLPNDKDGLQHFEEQLTATNLEQWLSKLDRPYLTEVKLYLPKFELKKSYELRGGSISLGINDAFIPGTANFTGMGLSKGVHISSVIHKSYVNVNEEGTEAAAVTAFVMADSVQPPPLEFRVDHPFVFMIRDNETGSILFLGRIANPTS